MISVNKSIPYSIRTGWSDENSESDPVCWQSKRPNSIVLGGRYWTHDVHRRRSDLVALVKRIGLAKIEWQSDYTIESFQEEDL